VEDLESQTIELALQHALIETGQNPVASNRDHMQLTPSHSIGHREAPIVKEADQRRPTVETVIDSIADLAVLETLARCS
jgi:hypothetical protein